MHSNTCFGNYLYSISIDYHGNLLKSLASMIRVTYSVGQARSYAVTK